MIRLRVKEKFYKIKRILYKVKRYKKNNSIVISEYKRGFSVCMLKMVENVLTCKIKRGIITV